MIPHWKEYHQPVKSRGRSKWKTLGTSVPSHKIEKCFKMLLTSSLRESITVFSFPGMVYGFQCEIRVVWGLSLISLASFHRFLFLPCQLTFLCLNMFSILWGFCPSTSVSRLFWWNRIVAVCWPFLFVSLFFTLVCIYQLPWWKCNL